MPGPCYSLPLHLDLLSQDLGRLLGAVGAAGLLVLAHGAGLPGTRWLWCWPEAAVSLWVTETGAGPENRRVVCELCKAALATLQDKELPSHTGCTNWSFGVSSTSERWSGGIESVSGLKVDCGGSVRLYCGIPFTRPEKVTYKMWWHFVPLLSITLIQP